MKQAIENNTSVSLGNRIVIIDEIKTKEDRSRSAVIRRAIDYYYMENYLPEVTPDKGDAKLIEQAIRDTRAGKGITLADYIKKNELDISPSKQGRKTTR